MSCNFSSYRRDEFFSRIQRLIAASEAKTASQHAETMAAMAKLTAAFEDVAQRLDRLEQAVNPPLQKPRYPSLTQEGK